MKRMVIFIGIVIFLAIISFIGFTSAILIIDDKEALLVGEDKYLQFLWMVDGAFNDVKYSNTLKVNGKELSQEKKIFKCIYKSKEKDYCFGENFEEAFSALFIHDIKYENVYSDGVSFTWYEKDNNRYKFKNTRACNDRRIAENHQMEVLRIEPRKITYLVKFADYKFLNKEIELVKEFVLEYHDNDWKVSKAYYHDPCLLDYNIEKSDKNKKDYVQKQ